MYYKSIFAFFWQHIKPYKWFYFVMLIAPIVGSFYPFAYNYSIKLFLDKISSDSALNYSHLIFPITLFLLAQLILEIVWRISNIAEWKSQPYIRRSILLSSYGYVQHHSYKFFQDNFSGAISSKIKGLLNGYDKFKAEMHHGLLLRLFKILVSISALLFINLKLGAFVMLWALVYVPLMYKLSIRLNKLSFAETESEHDLIGNISDNITNIISLFSFSARKREYQRLDKQITEDYIPKQIKVEKCNFLIQIVGGILYLVMFSFILFYMIHLKMHNLVTIGDFAFVFGISLMVAEDIWQATTSLQEFAKMMGDLKSSLSIIERPQQNIDAPEAKPIVVKNPKIDFKQVIFGYNQIKPIFDGLNLTIHPGEKIGLVGHSGSGKSTLVNIILRYFSIQNGEVIIDDQNINQITQDSLRENIAVIPQDTLLFHRSLLENIRYGKPDASDEEVIEASKKAHIHEFIQSLPSQYHTYVGERGIKLSGGQRQRIAIARAILKDAPILILDEATSSLDSHTESLIQDSLNFYIEDKQKTVIAIAHRLSTLKHMDRIIVLDKGKIVEQGTHENLIQHEASLYKKLWELQEI